MPIELGVVEQRHKAVLEVMGGLAVTEVALRYGVTRQTVRRWLARPKPVAARPGPADDAVAAKAAVIAYYAALAKADAAAAAALYSPQAVFQDTTTTQKAGGMQEAAAWFAKAAAVPNRTMEVKSVIAGTGWSVARWVFSGDASNGVYSGVRGATVFEVRDGKIVRQTVYYSLPGSPFS